MTSATIGAWRPSVATPVAVDEARLEDDLQYRFNYLAHFLGFGHEDIRALHDVAEHLGPKVAGLVDAIYAKLFSYQATKRHFAQRHHGFDGEVPQSVEAVSLDDEQVRFRKNELSKYLERLITADFDTWMISYLDFVGRTHTPLAGSKTIGVPLVQMNALLGYVSATLTEMILGLDVDEDMKRRVLLAVTKLLWIQSDLISRHYVTRPATDAITCCDQT